MELLTLDLKSPLDYARVENPPLSGAPPRGAPPRGALPRGAPLSGEAMAEGEEEIFLFDEAALVAFDPDEGPALRLPLPWPSFHGRRGPGAAGLGGSPEAGQGTRLEPGRYAFAQWRALDDAQLAAGLEWFARETWWARLRLRGPYILRRVREEGRLAVQALRRLEG